MLDEWVTKVKDELGIADEVDVDALLDLARDVAHGTERRAAPVTTYLVGLAAGRAGGGEATGDAIERVARLLDAPAP